MTSDKAKRPGHSEQPTAMLSGYEIALGVVLYELQMVLTTEAQQARLPILAVQGMGPLRVHTRGIREIAVRAASERRLDIRLLMEEDGRNWIDPVTQVGSFLVLWEEEELGSRVELE